MVPLRVCCPESVYSAVWADGRVRSVPVPGEPCKIVPCYRRWGRPAPGRPLARHACPTPHRTVRRRGTRFSWGSRQPVDAVPRASGAEPPAPLGRGFFLRGHDQKTSGRRGHSCRSRCGRVSCPGSTAAALAAGGRALPSGGLSDPVRVCGRVGRDQRRDGWGREWAGSAEQGALCGVGAQLLSAGQVGGVFDAFGDQRDVGLAGELGE